MTLVTSKKEDLTIDGAIVLRAAISMIPALVLYAEKKRWFGLMGHLLALSSETERLYSTLQQKALGSNVKRRDKQ